MSQRSETFSIFLKILLITKYFAILEACTANDRNVNSCAAQDTTNRGGYALAGQDFNGHSVRIQEVRIPDFGKTISENARINLMEGGGHSVDVNALHARAELNNGLKYDTVGGNVAWNHEQGHGVSAGISSVPKFDMKTIDAAARANLWTSENNAAKLNAEGTARRHISGPFVGRNDFGIGVEFVYRF